MWYSNIQFTSGDVALVRVGRNISRKTPLQSKAHHGQLGREHMASILFDVGLRLNNGEDPWTNVKLNPKLDCPNGKIMYQLTRRGVIVRTWREGLASPGLSRNRVEDPSRVVVAYKGRSHTMERYASSYPTRENDCTTFFTSWIEYVSKHYKPGPHLPWERNACAVKKSKGMRKVP